MKKKLSLLVAFILTFCLVFVCVFPCIYAGDSPIERILRMQDGGNFAKTALDSLAVMYTCKSGVFDIETDGQTGVYAYTIDTKQNRIESYYTLGSGNNESAEYILIKDGIRYSFLMDSDGWKFDGKRDCAIDLAGLCKNLCAVLRNDTANIPELEMSLNGFTGIDLSDYFDFSTVPTVIRALIEDFGEDDFLTAAGYSFASNGFALQYNFSPPNVKAFAERVNAVAQISYTNLTRSIVSIAGVTGGIADLFGFDFYGFLFDADISFSMGAFSGKLKRMQIKTKDSIFTATARQYGGSEIRIDSPTLEALLAKYVF